MLPSSHTLPPPPSLLITTCAMSVHMNIWSNPFTEITHRLSSWCFLHVALRFHKSILKWMSHDMHGLYNPITPTEIIHLAGAWPSFHVHLALHGHGMRTLSIWLLLYQQSLAWLYWRDPSREWNWETLRNPIVQIMSHCCYRRTRFNCIPCRVL